MEKVNQDLTSVADELWSRVEHIPECWVHRINHFKDLQKKIKWSRIAAERFPQNPYILYNLGCFLALNKEYPEAKVFIMRASEIDEKFLLLAFDDDDLNDFWGYWDNALGLDELLFGEKAKLIKYQGNFVDKMSINCHEII